MAKPHPRPHPYSQQGSYQSDSPSGAAAPDMLMHPAACDRGATHGAAWLGGAFATPPAGGLIPSQSANSGHALGRRVLQLWTAVQLVQWRR